ncbi:MAG: alpha/beta fold hydrolase [Nakamurella sp.]
MRYLLVPGAGGSAWYWSRVVPLLESAGHDVIAVDLPGDDESAGLTEYADIVVAAAAGARDVVLVAQSMGGFTAPMVCERICVRELVLVNAMIPTPGETAGQWWVDIDSATAQREAAVAGGYGAFDLATYFLHDVPPDVAAEGEPYQRPEADIAFTQPCAFTSWPNVVIRVLVGADDRFFPASFQRRVSRERLGVEIDILPGGHLLALANPTGVADYLLKQ